MQQYRLDFYFSYDTYFFKTSLNAIEFYILPILLRIRIQRAEPHIEVKMLALNGKDNWLQFEIKLLLSH
jgi:hypothetical protein